MELGKYVVIEGHDGTGKSTQIELLRNRLSNIAISSVEIQEPGGSPLADAIRIILKNGDLPRDAESNLLLFTTARHELWRNIAEPALKMGKWVVASRNYFSSLAYQGYGEGIDLDLINKTTEKWTGERYMNPDLALILDLDDETERFKRIGNRGELENPDTFESKGDDFQTKVREGYLKIAHEKDVPIISANQTIEQISKDIWAHIENIK